MSRSSFLFANACNALFCSVLLSLASAAHAGDWPQILGPQRNGIAQGEKLLNRWPKTGPTVLWERPVGSGYAGLAVSGEIAILFHRQRSEEVVEALDPATGKTLWKQGYPTDFRPQVGGGDGPLCVPTISQNKVVTFGPQGVLSCWELQSGKMLWQRKTHADYGAQEGYFGAGSAPLVVGELVIVNVGGDRKGAGFVAFRLADGTEAWKGISDQAGYSAPIQVDIDGVPHVAAVSRLKCTLFDAKSGAMRFQFPFGSRGPTVNGASPVAWDDRLFVTASYGVGATQVQYNLLAVEPVWEKEDVLSSQYTTPILLDGHLYGIHGRDDVPPADLKCINAETGKVLWTEQNFGYATLIAADGKLLAAKTDGELVLMAVSPDKATVLSRFYPFRGTLRALPALANGRLLIRDDSTLKCLQLAP